jgi:hypothetical protein
MTCILISRSIGGIFVDVVISEEHTATMEIAEHPVESGAKISDHAWRAPYSVTLESVIGSGRTVASFQALLALQAKAEPFDLVTGLKVYSNMLLKELTATRDAEHSRVLKFTAELQEVIIVNTQTSSGGETSEDKAKATTKRGQVAARESRPPVRTSSVLSDAVR